MEKFRPWLAEFIGTFALIFVGIGAIKTAGHDVLGIALAHGLTIAVFASATMHISGGNLNPAVTFGLLCGGHMPLATAIRYWSAQLLGGFTACVDLPGPVWSRSGGHGNTPARDQSERDARNSGRGHPHLLSGLRRLWDGSRRTRPRTRWICNWGNGHARYFVRRPVDRRGDESRPRFWTSSGIMVLA